MFFRCGTFLQLVKEDIHNFISTYVLEMTWNTGDGCSMPGSPSLSNNCYVGHYIAGEMECWAYLQPNGCFIGCFIWNFDLEN